MFERTQIPEARWWVVQGADKKKARLNCISHLLTQLPCTEVAPEMVVFPPEMIVPEIC